MAGFVWSACAGLMGYHYRAREHVLEASRCQGPGPAAGATRERMFEPAWTGSYTLVFEPEPSATRSSLLAFYLEEQGRTVASGQFDGARADRASGDARQEVLGKLALRAAHRYRLVLVDGGTPEAAPGSEGRLILAPDDRAATDYRRAPLRFLAFFSILWFTVVVPGVFLFASPGREPGR